MAAVHRWSEATIRSVTWDSPYRHVSLGLATGREVYTDAADHDTIGRRVSPSHQKDTSAYTAADEWTDSPPWRKPRRAARFQLSDHARASMKTAADLLKSKPHQSVYTITPETSVLDALKVMADKDVGALLVMEGDKLAGIVSERDYARKVALMSRTSALTAVREIMTSSVICVQPTQTTEDCMVLMTEHRLRHLPIMEGDQLLGLISIGDLVKDIISEQRYTIRQLEQYISG